MSSKSSRKRKNKSLSKSSPNQLGAFNNSITSVETAKSKIPKTLNMEHRLKLTSTFYNKSTLDLAKSLLGKILVHNVDGCLLKCRIVETELYPGGDDKASVSYNNRCTPANEQVFMSPGTIWVYLTYGMYHCINISSNDFGGAVLLRAGEPLIGMEKMSELRMSKLKTKKSLKPEQLCNGPSKLCISMGIVKATCNAVNVAEDYNLWLEDDAHVPIAGKVVCAKRIGIDRAGDIAVNQLWRFYFLGNPNVSKHDVKCEVLME